MKLTQTYLQMLNLKTLVLVVC